MINQVALKPNPFFDISSIAPDIFRQMKIAGQHAAVKRLWEIVGPLLRDHGFNAGSGASTANRHSVLQQQQQQQQQQRSPPFSPKSPTRERRMSSAVLIQRPSGQAYSLQAMHD
jgi:hypothetical protein